MELTFDWKIFQNFFYSKKQPIPDEDAGRTPIYLVLEGRQVVAGLLGGEAMHAWVGLTQDEVQASLPGREFCIYDRTQIDAWVTEAMEGIHFYDQMEKIRVQAKLGVQITRNHEIHTRKHFLLHAIETWWQKVFPSVYGVYIQLKTDSAPLSLFLMVQRGKLESFHTPDLSSLLPYQRSQANQVIRHLSSHYRVPVQGLFLDQQTWMKWSALQNPWREIAQALKANRLQIVPRHLGLFTLIFSRRYFRI